MNTSTDKWMNERMRTNKSCFFLCFVCVNALDLLHVALCGAVWRCGFRCRASAFTWQRVESFQAWPSARKCFSQRGHREWRTQRLGRNSKAAIPICSMVLEISQHLPEQNQPNVGKYTMHGAYGIHIPFPMIIWCSENHNVLKGKGNLREPKTLH